MKINILNESNKIFSVGEQKQTSAAAALELSDIMERKYAISVAAVIVMVLKRPISRGSCSESLMWIAENRKKSPSFALAFLFLFFLAPDFALFHGILSLSHLFRQR